MFLKVYPALGVRLLLIYVSICFLNHGDRCSGKQDKSFEDVTWKITTSSYSKGCIVQFTSS